MSHKLSIVFLLFASLCMAHAEDTGALFRAANQACQSGNYNAAMEGYEKITTTGIESPDVYYNLGAAYQMLGQPVHAVFNYRRALMLKPTLLQARRSLESIAQTQGIPMPRFTWREEVSSVILPLHLISGGVIAAWMGAFLFVFAFLRKRPRFWWLSVSVVLILMGKSLALLGFLCDPKVAYAHSAIVTAPEAIAAHAAPADSSASLTKLVPGTGVNVLSNRGVWSYCQLPDNINAWLPSKNLTMVVPSGSPGG
ncbi:MAG: tetratricopeptide repeat protein [Chthoniobacterales bacterium]